jgi:hypothetical protein
MEEAEALAQYGPKHLFGGQLLLTAILINRIVTCAHFHRIENIDRLRFETRWILCDQYGDEILKLIRSTHPPHIQTSLDPNPLPVLFPTPVHIPELPPPLPIATPIGSQPAERPVGTLGSSEAPGPSDRPVARLPLAKKMCSACGEGRI